MSAKYEHASAADHAPPALPASAPSDETEYAQISLRVDTFLQSFEELSHPLCTDKGGSDEPHAYAF